MERGNVVMLNRPRYESLHAGMGDFVPPGLKKHPFFNSSLAAKHQPAW